MAQLTNPISSQNIVDRFADFIKPTANQGITWGTDNVPFGEMSTGYFGGPAAGKDMGISSASFSDTAYADEIFNTLVGETQQFARIRRLRAILYVDGGGGNTGSRGSPGEIYNSHAIAHLNSNYAQSITSDRSNVSFGNAITTGGLESLFQNLANSYTAVRENVQEITIHVCHASCHSSCHSSRGRR